MKKICRKVGCYYCNRLRRACLSQFFLNAPTVAVETYHTKHLFPMQEQMFVICRPPEALTGRCAPSQPSDLG